MLHYPKLTLLLCGVLLTFILTGCGQTTPSPVSGAISREETVTLPTAMPTIPSTPVNTRVLPTDSLTPSPTFTTTPIPDEARGVVVGIIDGHTILVVMEGDTADQANVVRYLGIEAPPPDDPWGAVARETNRKLTSLRAVELVRDKTNFTDEGYLLRYVYTSGQLMSIILAEQGLAKAAVSAPDTRFEEEILEAEARAKEGKLGIWSDGTPSPTPSPVVVGKEEIATETPVAAGTLTPEITVTGAITTTAEATSEIEAEGTITATVTVSATVDAAE